MKVNRMRRVAVQAMLAGLLCGTTFDLTGCAGSLVQSINPCGTILTCDPQSYELLFHDVPDFQYNPTCTLPGLICSGGTTTPITTTTNSGTGSNSGLLQ